MSAGGGWGQLGGGVKWGGKRVLGGEQYRGEKETSRWGGIIKIPNVMTIGEGNEEKRRGKVEEDEETELTRCEGEGEVLSGESLKVLRVFSRRDLS